VVCDNPFLILDGAHNPEAAMILAKSLRDIIKNRKIGLICGMCSDKNALDFALSFRGLANQVWIVPIASERNIDNDVLKAAFSFPDCKVFAGELNKVFKEANRWAISTDGAVVITGSLFLVGEVIDKMESGILRWEVKT